MVWEYLAQFWDSITAQTIGGVEYTIAWFQQIGNAVAGAMGQFFDVIFHNINDAFVLIAWFGYALKVIFTALLSPINYFANVLRFFFATAFSTPPTAEATYTFSNEVLEVFNTIPHWPIFASVLGAIIILICGIGMLKLLLRT